MEHAHFVEQNNRDPATFAFTDFGAKLLEESFDILPLDVCAGWMSEDKLKGSLVLPLHPQHGITREYQRTASVASDG